MTLEAVWDLGGVQGCGMARTWETRQTISFLPHDGFQNFAHFLRSSLTNGKDDILFSNLKMKKWKIKSNQALVCQNLHFPLPSSS